MVFIHIITECEIVVVALFIISSLPIMYRHSYMGFNSGHGQYINVSTVVIIQLFL